MAHYYGTLQGHRGLASRLGTASSGLVNEAASWEGKVTIRLYRNTGPDGVERDYARVCLEPHHGHGTHRQLYDGPVSGETVKQRKRS